MNRHTHPSLRVRAGLRWGLLVTVGLAMSAVGCRQDGPAAQTAAPAAPLKSSTAHAKSAALEPAVAPAKRPATQAPPAKAKALGEASRTVVAKKLEPVAFPPFTGKTIAIVHTANMVGEIEPCG